MTETATRITIFFRRFKNPCAAPTPTQRCIISHGFWKRATSPLACRRLMVCACEDVGLAWPQIIPIVKAAVDAAMMVGLPEARIPLADAVILTAMAPKSNSGESAIDAAMRDVKAGKLGVIPRTLQNVHYDGSDVAKKGQFYRYPHDYPDHWLDQQYLPDALLGASYYHYGDNKNEQAFKAYWENIKRKHSS